MAETDDRLARLEVLLTEMDRRIELRFEQLEKRMVEGFTAVNLRVEHVERRTGEGFAATNQRIDDVVHRMGEGFAATNQRIDDVVHRMDGLDTRLLAIEGRLTIIEKDKADRWTVNLWGATLALVITAATALAKLWL